MALYRVLETSYVNDRIYEAGELVEYNPPKGTIVGPNLKPAPRQLPAGVTEKED